MRHQTFGNQSLGLLQVSFTFTQYVKMCQQDCTRDGSSTPICKKKARHNRSRSFEITRMFFYQEQRPKQKHESFFKSGKQNKIYFFNVNGYFDQCKLVFEALGCYYQFCYCQEARPSLRDLDNDRGKQKEMNDTGLEYIKKERIQFCRKVSSGKTSKPMIRSKIMSKPFFRTKNLVLRSTGSFLAKKIWISLWLCSV